MTREQKVAEMLVMMLDAIAPAVEAAGTIQRAVRLGVVGSFGCVSLDMLTPVIPKSRGGKCSHPDSESDWLELVADAVERRDLDLDAMRETFNAMERGAQ